MGGGGLEHLARVAFRDKGGQNGTKHELFTLIFRFGRVNLVSTVPTAKLLPSESFLLADFQGWQTTPGWPDQHLTAAGDGAWFCAASSFTSSPMASCTLLASCSGVVIDHFGASRQTMGTLASITRTVAYGSCTCALSISVPFIFMVPLYQSLKQKTVSFTLAAIINGTLVTKWGCRNVGFAGACIFSVGLMASSLAPNMTYLFFSTSILAGI